MSEPVDRSASAKPRRAASLALLLPPLLGAGLGYLLASSALGAYGADDAWLRQRIGVLGGFDLLAIPILILLVFAVHEAGHLLGGFSRGMRFLLFIVGPFQWSRSASGIRFNWVFSLGTLGGLAAATPDPNRPMVQQLTRLIIGGPLASLLLALLALAFAALNDGRAAGYALVTSAISTMVFLVTALPMRAGGYMSDGMQLLELMRGGPAVLERQILTTLMAQSFAGVRPRDWDGAAIAKALAMDSKESIRRIAAHIFALYQAMDRADDDALARHADWLQANVQDYPDGFRQSILIELSWVAVRRGDGAAARDFWQRSRGGVVEASRRALVQAALALQDNDHVAAGKALAESRRTLGRAIDQGMAQLTRDQIVDVERQLRDTPNRTAA